MIYARAWFRHRLATEMMGDDIRSARWLDAQSVTGDAHDVPERQRRMLNEINSICWTRI
jgi:hypothetical protein